MHGKQVPRKVKQTREYHRTLHISAVEVEDGDHTGGNRTTATMRSLWYAHAIVTDDETQTDGAMLECDGYASNTMGCVDVRYFHRDGVKLVWERGERTGVGS